MSKICILGIKGAGKTVLISVLANRYREICSGKPYMEFKNFKTNRYVSTVWDRLTKERRWPDSTLPGSFESLEWVLHAQDGQTHGLKVLDTPGQDVQAIFSGQGNLSQAQRRLAMSIEAANCVVFLVNLCEIISAASAKERSDYESPIVLAIKSLLKRNARVAILLSQHDRLKRCIDGGVVMYPGEQRTLESESQGMSALEAVKRWLPAAYKVLKKASGDENSGIYVGFVSAVADTELREDEDGIVRNFPKENFESYGLEEALSWMTESISSRKAEVLHAWKKRVFVSLLKRCVVGGLLWALLVLVFGKTLVSCKEDSFCESAGAQIKKQCADELDKIESERGKIKASLEKNEKDEADALTEHEASEKRSLAEIDKKFDLKLRQRESDYKKRDNERSASLEAKEREKEKARSLLKELYCWKSFGSLKDSERDSNWTWKINKAMWGDDKVNFLISCCEAWKKAKITIYPENKDLVPFLKEHDFSGNNEISFEYNFKGDGAEARLELYVRNTEAEKEDSTKYEALISRIEADEDKIELERKNASLEYENDKRALEDDCVKEKKVIVSEYKKLKDDAQARFDKQTEALTKADKELEKKANAAKCERDKKIGDIALKWREGEGKHLSTLVSWSLFLSLLAWIVAWAIVALRIFRKNEISNEGGQK